MFGEFQSMNSTSSTFRPALAASSTATSRGGAKAAVVPTLRGLSAPWAMPVARSRPRVRILRRWLGMVSVLEQGEWGGNYLVGANSFAEERVALPWVSTGRPSACIANELAPTEKRAPGWFSGRRSPRPNSLWRKVPSAYAVL
ncbi:hypothetical protein D9M69_639250 [compost metagenome]